MKISQREARRLRKRVADLERADSARRERWTQNYPGGTNIDTLTVSEVEWFIVRTARMLGHACVVIPGNMPQLLVYALPQSNAEGGQ